MADVPARGLFASLRGLAATAVAIVQTRLELLGTELQEEKARLLGLLAFGAAALILLAAGLVFLAVFLTVLLWDNNRLLALGVFAALFLGGGAVSLLVALRHARTPSRLFAASLAELARDRAAAEGTTPADP
jgi:uncharacterized membrane protein YqjE